ncbi:hypothetical protein CBS101457_005073 [Exobasidium rhododendri]|nr:hypothetical protein CBS101457_005073 [Exobasidium rhododendri]
MRVSLSVVAGTISAFLSTKLATSSAPSSLHGRGFVKCKTLDIKFTGNVDNHRGFQHVETIGRDTTARGAQYTIDTAMLDGAKISTTLHALPGAPGKVNVFRMSYNSRSGYVRTKYYWLERGASCTITPEDRFFEATYPWLAADVYQTHA